MIRLLKWLFYGDAHLHKREIISERVMTNDKQDWVRYVLQCKHCGDLKTFNSCP